MKSRELKAILETAHARREDLRRIYSSYRLIHNAHDGLPGVELEIYGNIVALRTATREADALIEMLTATLAEIFHPAAILLKNHFHRRQSAGLALRDEILCGALAENKVPISEHGFTFAYSTDASGMFPLADRPLRLWLNESPMGDAAPVLLAGFATEEMIAAEHLDSAHARVHACFAATQGLGITDATVSLRESAQAEPDGFATAVIDLGFIRNLFKNRKAAHHILYNLFKLMRTDGVVCVKSPHGEELHNILGQIGRKRNRQIRLTAMESPGEDFPFVYGGNTAMIQYLRLHV